MREELPFGPDELPAFELLEFLDRGSMGAVWRARQKSLNRLVAIKLLDARIEAGDARERFLREAHMAARLLHPNIVAVFDAGEAGSVPYIVFELVEGETLAKRMVRAGALDAKTALGFARGIAEGLGAAHRSGIVHRDLKPQNVLITAADQPKIADFGISKSLSGDGPRTKQNLILGTPLYMSPEQARGEPLGPASDLYSLGVILYEMLAGRPPFDGSVTEVLKAHVTTTPPPLASRTTSASGAVVRIVERALEKDPKARWSNAEEMATALNKAWMLASTGSRRLPDPPGESATDASWGGGESRPDSAAGAVASMASPTVVSDSGRRGIRSMPQGPTRQSGVAKGGPQASSARWRAVAAAIGAVLLVAGLLFRGSPRNAAVVREPPSVPAVTPDAWSTGQTGGTPEGLGAVRGNRNSHIYFLPGDEPYERIHSMNRVEFASEESARKAGYRKYRGGRRRLRSDSDLPAR
ncbi:MAG: serine/threonine protein kinase [Candidatus Wallbacteria bacterium]|nr:serine/threonine protein kinase [Candidatus Wallbacteria bacterium]